LQDVVFLWCPKILGDSATALQVRGAIFVREIGRRGNVGRGRVGETAKIVKAGGIVPSC
jgi:hypothetical protein